MPRRKRGANLAPRSASAQSMRRARQEETEEEASQRRSQNAAETSRARANETDDQTTHRNALNAARTAACRACETNEEASQRWAANAAQTATSRQNESANQRTTRRAAEFARELNRIANESSQEISQRLDAQRSRSARAAVTRRRRTPLLRNAAINYSADSELLEDDHMFIGELSIVCLHCSAFKWPGETEGMCCSKGKVQLPEPRSPPDGLRHLLTASTGEAKHFQANIASYNAAFQMTSFGATSIVKQPGFSPTFTVQGKVYHRIGPAIPAQNQRPSFLQLYFLGLEEQLQQRRGIFDHLRIDIIRDLQDILNQENSYVLSFKTAIDQAPGDQYKLVIHADRQIRGHHRGTLNAPSTNEVAVIMSTEPTANRDIVVYPTDNNAPLQRIAETNRAYDPLQYPLLFPFGEDGYQFGIFKQNPATGRQLAATVSAMEFYGYKFMIRPHEFNTVLTSRKLAQQYFVDMYAKIETDRLLYLRMNQAQLRASEYIHLQDSMNNEGHSRKTGQMVILPSSFMGGPRYMHEKALDALAICRKHGKPHLFITFTYNPNWPEISSNLFQGQASQDRHDIIARVFNLKLQKLLKNLCEQGVFGQCKCYVASVEWQKRGIPHAHILLWLADPVHPNDFDKYVSAELPSEQDDEELFSIIKRHMIHGPCGSANPNSPCMKDGKCTKKYPRRLVLGTQTDTDGYPRYRRRSVPDGGSQFTMRVRSRDVIVDNSWVVPYNRFLSRICNAHINVEICQSVKSIKYVCKYVHKGQASRFS